MGMTFAFPCAYAVGMAIPERFLGFLHSYVSLFSGVVGAVATVVLLAVKNFLTRPRLGLSFDSSNEAYMSTSTYPEGSLPVTVTRKYLRVSLKATGILGRCRYFKGKWGNIFGSSGAENCLIYITAIRPIVAGRAGDDQLYDARIVSWPPNKSFGPRYIPRGVTMFANVVTMKQGHLGWRFEVPDSYGLDSVRNHMGPLLLRVTATAKNADPESIDIEASIKPDKLGFEARLVKR